MKTKNSLQQEFFVFCRVDYSDILDMKKKCFIILLIVSELILNVSCIKKSAASEADETLVKSTVLLKDAQLYLFGRDEKMHPVLKVSAGEEVYSVFLKDKPQIKKLANNQKEYVLVVYDNVDYYVEKSCIALKTVPAVVVEKAFVFSDKNLTKAVDSSSNPLRFSTVIACDYFEEDDESKDESETVKIFYYDKEKNDVVEAYISALSISVLEDDIIVSSIVEELKTTTRAVPRNELFSKASKYNPGQKVLAALNEQKVEKKMYSYKQVLKSVKKMSYGVNVDELMTVDQSKDPFK